MAFDLSIGRLRKLNQREITLVVLAGVIGIVAMFYFLRGEGGIGFTGPESRFTAEEARAEIKSLLRVPPIDLARLDETSDTFRNDRNLFAYGQAKRPPQGGPGGGGGGNGGQGPNLPGAGGSQPVEDPEDVEEKTPVDKLEVLPDPPEMNLQFVGFIGPPAEKTVFLTDEDAEENYIGGVGDAIAGQFRILEIGYEYVDIGYTDPLFEGQSERVILAEWSEEEEEEE